LLKGRRRRAVDSTIMADLRLHPGQRSPRVVRRSARWRRSPRAAEADRGVCTGKILKPGKPAIDGDDTGAAKDALVAAW